MKYTQDVFLKSLAPADKLGTKATGIKFFYLNNQIVSEDYAKEFFEQNKKECCAFLRNKNNCNKNYLRAWACLLFSKREIYYSRFPEEGDPYPDIKLTFQFAHWLLQTKWRKTIHNVISYVKEHGVDACVAEADGYFFEKRIPNEKIFTDESDYPCPLFIDAEGQCFSLSYKNGVMCPWIRTGNSGIVNFFVPAKGKWTFIGHYSFRYNTDCVYNAMNVSCADKFYFPVLPKTDNKYIQGKYIYYPRTIQRKRQEGCITHFWDEPDKTKPYAIEYARIFEHEENENNN